MEAAGFGPTKGMEVSEYPESGRDQHEQADDNVVTINRHKGKLFTVLGTTDRTPLSASRFIDRKSLEIGALRMEFGG